jgi:putative PIN family toxin of toxin-antitoxin system
VIGVTADSNIYISGLVFAGPPLQFLDAALAGRCQLSLSAPLLDEIYRVLRDKFLWPQARLDALPSRLEKFTQRVHPTVTLDAVQSDPDDNRVLECAIAASSQFIVSGDKHLLDLGQFRNIQIGKVADFLKLIPAP